MEQLWTDPPGVDGVPGQSAALAPLPEVVAGLLAAGVDEVEPADDELSDDEEPEDALSEADEVLRLSVR